MGRGKVYYTGFMTDIGKISVAFTAKGVCRILLPSESEEGFFEWLEGVFGRDNVIAGNGKGVEGKENMGLVMSELTAYARGKLQRFTCPVDLIGTGFQRVVWRCVREVPYGSTITYKELASRAGKPGAARAVGAACGANTVPIIVPCHRVIGCDGSLVGYTGGLEFKKYLLALERQTGEVIDAR